MIIDARTTSETKHGRPYTFSAAVANALDEIGLGDSLMVEKAVDPSGKDMSISRLSMGVSRHKGDRVFTVRRPLAGQNILATITRLK